MMGNATGIEVDEGPRPDGLMTCECGSDAFNVGIDDVGDGAILVILLRCDECDNLMRVDDGVVRKLPLFDNRKKHS